MNRFAGASRSPASQSSPMSHVCVQYRCPWWLVPGLKLLRVRRANGRTPRNQHRGPSGLSVPPVSLASRHASRFWSNHAGGEEPRRAFTTAFGALGRPRSARRQNLSVATAFAVLSARWTQRAASQKTDEPSRYLGLPSLGYQRWIMTSEELVLRHLVASLHQTDRWPTPSGSFFHCKKGIA